MEKKNQIIKAQELPDRLQRYCPEMYNELPLIKTWVDKKIIDYEPDEFVKALKVVLAEVVFITGGKMYDDLKQSQFYKFQIQTISKFLLSSFNYFSFSEISQAFYLNTAGKFSQIHTHYGREINIEFIGSVLADYKKYKQDLFNQYGHQLQPVLFPTIAPVERKLTEEDYMNDQRKSIEDAYQRLLVDLDMNDELFPEYFYNTLVYDKLISEAAYKERLISARHKIAKSKQMDIMKSNFDAAKSDNINGSKLDGSERVCDTTSIQKELEKLRLLVRTNQIEKNRPVVTVSKQMIVKEFFLERMGNGFLNIYVEDAK